MDSKEKISTSSQRDLYLQDSYEDEYDDTYDDADAQIVDPSLSADEAVPAQVRATGSSGGKGGKGGKKDRGGNGDGEDDEEGVYEQKVLLTLANARAKDVSVFERSNTARRSAAREELRKTTTLSDEQIEGWFVMVLRDVRVLWL